MSLNIPWPDTLFQVTWALIGFTFARAFGKQLDQDIQSSHWFKSLQGSQSLIWGIVPPELLGNLILRLLDFLHHFWMGLLLMIYYPASSELYWVGWGLVLDDAPDIPARFAGYFTYLQRED